MDRIAITGGARLEGVIPISGRQELRHQADGGEPADRPAAAPDQHAAAGRHALSRPVCCSGWASIVEEHDDGDRAGDDADHAGNRLGDRALRPGPPDARLVQRAGAAVGAHRPGQGLAAGRLRDRRAAGRPAPDGAGGAGRADRPVTKATSTPRRRAGSEGRGDPVPAGLGRRDRARPARGGAGPGRDGDRQRRLRAGDRRPGRLPEQDGREDRGRGHPGDPHPRRRPPVLAPPTR